MKRMRARCGALVVAIVAAPACASDVKPSTLAVDRTSIVAGLCASRSAAANGRLVEARTIFDDRVHESLHVLAADAGAVDRARSARLLEAKQVVEARFAQLDPEVVDALAALVGPVVDALGALDVSGPDGCEEHA